MDPCFWFQKGRAKLVWFVTLCLSLTVLSAAAVSAEGQDPPAGPVAYDVTQDIMVRMRDGVRLATNLYQPKTDDDRQPTIAIRLPYNKDTYWRATQAATYFASHGYNVVVQDMRGKWKSEGVYRIFHKDREDGYDLLSWIVDQPWATDKVGTFGCSYLGETQMLLAAAKHPAHAAMIPMAAGGAIGSMNGRHGYFGMFRGGAFALAAGFGWFPERGGLIDKTEDPHTITNKSKKLKQLPVIDLLKQEGVGPTNWEDFLSRPFTDPWWEESGYITDQDTFDVPALHVNSWYDGALSDTLAFFNRMRTHSLSAKAREHQYAILSPATHCRSEELGKNAVVGETPVGDASFPYWETYLMWFNHWLKGQDTGITSMPKLQYFVTPTGTWETADQWPSADSQTVRFYLTSGGSANTRHGDGQLTRHLPGDAPSDRFRYDPDTPVPSRGGSACCTGNPDTQPGIFDHSDLEDREDILVYTSEPLDEAFDLAGPMALVLHISSDAADTDFTAKLLDVAPDGTALNIQNGILRARYREGYENHLLMTPGEVYRIRIDLQDTAYRLAKGHRLRLEVSSSDFPQFDRNLNTGGPNHSETKWVVATNTVHHTRRHPSYVTVTVR